MDTKYIDSKKYLDTLVTALHNKISNLPALEMNKERTNEKMCVSDSRVRSVRLDMCSRFQAAKETDKKTEREGGAKETVLNRDGKIETQPDP